MNRFKKFLALMVAIMLLCTGTVAMAKFDEDAAKSCVYQLNVVYEMTIPDLDNALCTAWASATAFSVGDKNGTASLAADASLLESDRIFESLYPDLEALFAAGGQTVTPETLESKLSLDRVSLYLLVNGSNVQLNVLEQDAAPRVMLLQPASAGASIPNDSFMIADTAAVASGDTVYSISLKKTQEDGTDADAADLDDMISSDSPSIRVTSWGFTTDQTTISQKGTFETSGVSAFITPLERSRFRQGAPLLSEGGSVVGMSIWYADSASTVSVSAEELIKAMTAAGVNYEVGEASGHGGLQEVMIYLVILVAVLVILIVLLIVLRARSKRREQEEMERLEESAQKKREEERRVHMERMAANQAARPAAPVAAAAPASQQPKIVPAVSKPAAEPVRRPKMMSVNVLGGVMKGQHVHSGGTLLLGRDLDKCRLIFPAETTEISRAHCMLTWDPKTQSAALEDLNSVNGTYLASGARLIPGKKYPLRSGDRFYLAKAEHMLEVRW